MLTRRRSDAERILGMHFDQFAAIVQTGNDSFWMECGHLAYKWESWTKRSIIRDEIIQPLITYTEGVDGASVTRQGNATYFNYYNEFIIKVNKLDDGLVPNVNGTLESKGYFTQAPDLFSFFEMEELERTGSVTHMGPTTIFLGYVPTENNPREPLSYLTCFDDQGRLAWDIPLRRGATPPPVTISPPADSGEPPRVRILPAIKKAG